MNDPGITGLAKILFCVNKNVVVYSVFHYGCRLLTELIIQNSTVPYITTYEQVKEVNTKK